MTRPSESGARRAARRRVAIPVFTIVAILLTPVTEGVGAQAAGETCRGREATIVGGPLRGTGRATPAGASGVVVNRHLVAGGVGLAGEHVAGLDDVRGQGEVLFHRNRSQ